MMNFDIYLVIMILTFAFSLCIVLTNNRITELEKDVKELRAQLNKLKSIEE